MVYLDDGQRRRPFTVGLKVDAASRDISDQQQIVLRQSIHGKPPADSIGQACRATIFCETRSKIRAEVDDVIASVPHLPLMVAPLMAGRISNCFLGTAGLPNAVGDDGANRSQDTRPEIVTRSAVSALGTGSETCHCSSGNPDLANRDKRWAIFVHGRLWHSHENCGLASNPKSNRGYWTRSCIVTRTR